MPTARGITVQIIAEVDSRVFPEFPCPLSTQSKISEAVRRSAGPMMISGSKADRVLGRDPITSVYIPSIPDLRFSVKYTIENEPVKGQFWYFKLIMNGREITSWGVDPATNSRGVVARALFEPNGWDIEENGQVLRHKGTEARPFLFSSKKAKSAALDGGYIEIRVMRSSGRVRVAPILGSHRPQDAYGLLLPAGPLVKNPNDMKYYDWILIDSKDSPYATFRFHYRGWDFLNKLELVPKEHRRGLLKPSNSSFLLDKQLAPKPLVMRADEKSKGEHRNDGKGDEPKNQQFEAEEEFSNLMRRSQSLNIGTRQPRRGTGRVFEEFESGSVAHYRPTFPTKSPGPKGMHDLKTHKSPMHKVPTQWSTDKNERELPIPISSFSAFPTTTLEEGVHNRPLPLPPRTSSLGHVRDPSVSSVSSLPVSITDSVAEADDPNSDEEEIGIATEVRVCRAKLIDIKRVRSPTGGDNRSVHGPRHTQMNQGLSSANSDTTNSSQYHLQLSYDHLPRFSSQVGMDVFTENPWNSEDDVFADRPSYSRDKRNSNLSFLTQPISSDRPTPPPQPVFNPPSIKIPGSPRLTQGFNRNVANSKLTPPPEGIFPPPSIPTRSDPHRTTQFQMFGGKETPSWAQETDDTKHQSQLMHTDIGGNDSEPLDGNKTQTRMKEGHGSSPWKWLTGSAGSDSVTPRQHLLASRARGRVEGKIGGKVDSRKITKYRKVAEVADEEESHKKKVTFADNRIFSQSLVPKLNNSSADNNVAK